MEAMPKHDAWDWPMLLYVGTVILGMSEAKFWRTTPRKLNALAKVHSDLNSSGADEDDKCDTASTGYIDQIF